MKKWKGKILVLFLAVFLVSLTSCKNPFLKKMLVEEEKGSESSVPEIEGFAVLILSPDKLTISVKAVTSDGSAVTVEGCTETSLASGSGTYTELHATGTVVILKGKIIELDCRANRLTALNVQGCTALQGLSCGGNQLTSLNAQDCTALPVLWCNGEQLTTLNVQGCTALKWLYCYNNRLTAEAFIKIFTDLPQRDAGNDARCYLYTEEPGVTEGNHTDFTSASAPQDLKDAFQNAKDIKHWRMYKYNGNWPGEEI